MELNLGLMLWLERESLGSEMGKANNPLFYQMRQKLELSLYITNLILKMMFI